MRIVQSNVQNQASHSFQSMLQTQTSVRYQAPEAKRPDVTLSDAALAKSSQEPAAQKADSNSEMSQLSPYLQLLKDLIEKLIGHEIHLLQNPISDPASTPAAASPATPAAPPTPDQTSGAGFAAEYSSTYSETESTHYSTAGTIQTSDGKQIQFSAQLDLARSYTQTVSEGVYAGSLAKPKQDPLVLNFGGTAGQLSSQTFAFDLNNNGQTEQISELKPGSAFLALDLNNNGKIDNGSELFGTKTGNGFAELAAYDQDHNGWIDENDAVFSKLKLWLKDDSGQNRLVDLKSMGIGAIYLGSSQADFNINDAHNNTLGQIRGSGVYLTESGQAGSLQQIDLSA
ncbi:hypothetical protein [Andreprevotia chitinilytica]|uniref:hypothetical protein n=1 Tax=Andreprevotia chitinilytica TaxID=396808 RepID=UPI00054F7B75|nr:hypothetical protein [Andreprevotia chitinilytica]